MSDPISAAALALCAALHVSPCTDYNFIRAGGLAYIGSKGVPLSVWEGVTAVCADVGRLQNANSLFLSSDGDVWRSIWCVRTEKPTS